jgi:acyl carrier protein
MSFEQFVAHLLVLLRIEIGRPANACDSLYEDLGLDSFQAFELLIIIEGLAEAMVPPMDLPELYTLADAFAYYQQLRAAELAGLE